MSVKMSMSGATGLFSSTAREASTATKIARIADRHMTQTQDGNPSSEAKILLHNCAHNVVDVTGQAVSDCRQKLDCLLYRYSMYIVSAADFRLWTIHCAADAATD